MLAYLWHKRCPSAGTGVKRIIYHIKPFRTINHGDNSTKQENKINITVRPPSRELYSYSFHAINARIFGDLLYTLLPRLIVRYFSLKASCLWLITFIICLSPRDWSGSVAAMERPREFPIQLLGKYGK